MTDRIALFPLSTVLLPGSPLPLLIFEPRYRQLLADLPDPAAFGVVSLQRGTETSADVAFAEVGTLAELLDRTPHPDGSSDILTVGSRRFRIREVDATGRPYLQATVDWLPEDDGPLPAGLLDAATTAFTRYQAAVARLSGAERPDGLTGDALRVSYELSAQLLLAPEEQQRLLEAVNATDRLAGTLAIMRRELTLLHTTRSIPLPPQALRIAAGRN